MKQGIIILFLLFHAFSYGQHLPDLLTKEMINDPEKAITNLKGQQPATGFELAKNQYLLGKCYAFLNQEDTALNYFLNSKKEFERSHLTEQAKDVALDAYLVISSQANYDKFGTSFLDEYFEYANKTESETALAYSYNEFAKNAYSSFDFENRSNPAVLDSAVRIFKKGIYYADKGDSPQVKAKLYTGLGVVYNTAKKYDSARFYLNKARPVINSNDNEYDLFVNDYNYGLSYFNEGVYTKALNWFLKAEKRELPYYRAKLKRGLYKKIAETYDYLNDHANRRKYQALYTALDNKLHDEEQTKMIHETSVKYEVAKKDRELSTLYQIKEKFTKNKIVFGVLLFLVFLLALYSYVRWKKVDHAKKQIEEEKAVIQVEHTKTVEQLEKVKQMVTDDYIVLKNRTKLYLDNLVYVKVEDHYLSIITSEGKNHFIRGRLTQLLSELPPNFSKCHRSYVVNHNYIKSVNSKVIVLTNGEEIPVSRNFKLQE